MLDCHLIFKQGQPKFSRARAVNNEPYQYLIWNLTGTDINDNCLSRIFFHNLLYLLRVQSKVRNYDFFIITDAAVILHKFMKSTVTSEKTQVLLRGSAIKNSSLAQVFPDIIILLEYI